MAKRSGKGNNQGPSPNDQRSDALNPASDAYRAAQINRANQLNPSHPTYGSSRTGERLPPKPAPSPNDQRSDVHNPNSRAYKAAQDNRADQLNPSHPAYRSSRGLPDEDE
jgi:hypothetical protein